jgi:hypothetical protein
MMLSVSRHNFVYDKNYATCKRGCVMQPAPHALHSTSGTTLDQNYIGKGKGHPITGHQGPRGGVEVELYSFSTSAIEGGGWSASCPGRFTPRKDPVQEAGWAPGPVWTCAKNLAPTGISSPDRPARSQSLYRLSYPAH